MVYKQRVLADFWGRKDKGVGINKLYRSFHVHGAVTRARRRLWLAQIGALFGSQNAIFVKYKYTWECRLIMFRIRVLGIQYGQTYSYNGKTEVGPNSA